jgi:hypothetical protein
MIEYNTNYERSTQYMYPVPLGSRKGTGRGLMECSHNSSRLFTYIYIEASKQM